MYRERLTITLEPEVVAAIDSLIDKERLRNRSQTIEFLLKEGLGIHQLTQAFLFFEPDFPQTELAVLLALLKTTSVSQLFFAVAPTLKGREAEIQALLEQNGSWSCQSLPSDFGSGGALLLGTPRPAASFLLCWLQNSTVLPASLITPYLSHRLQGATVTQLVASVGEEGYKASGVAFATPELLSHIPAGPADLRSGVFPELLKNGKMRGYIIS